MGLIKAALSVLLLATTTPWLGCGGGDEHRKRENKLIAEIDSLRAFVQSTRNLREDWRQRTVPVLLNKYDVEQLESKGLTNPLVAISKDLRSHPELIPANPVPEGMSKFGFYGDGTIHALTDKWILAEFSDGHGTGHMILQYSVTDSGKIRWTPLVWAWQGLQESTHVIK